MSSGIGSTTIGSENTPLGDPSIKDGSAVEPAGNVMHTPTNRDVHRLNVDAAVTGRDPNFRLQPKEKPMLFGDRHGFPDAQLTATSEKG